MAYRKLSDRDAFGYANRYRSAKAAGLVASGNDENTVMLFHFNETIENVGKGRAADFSVDASNKTFEAGPFAGAKALRFDGYSIDVPAAASKAFNGDFTFEMWLRADSNSQPFFEFETGASYGVAFTSFGGKYKMYASEYKISSHNAVANVWQHIAVQRTGSTLQFYLNGVPGTQEALTCSDQIPACKLRIGFWGGFSGHYGGLMAELRMSDVARYTDAFTPPTKPFN